MTRTWLLLLGALATVTFASLVLVVVPRLMLDDVRPPPQLAPYTAEQMRGRGVYIANGCLYCHSQQVRDPAYTTDVDRGWGTRASVPADFVYDRPYLVGTMRTGPDLLNVGIRLPDANWHLIHLYQPRSVTPWSIMPSFPYMFAIRDSATLEPGDRVVNVAGRYAPPRGKVVVAGPDAVALVDYLLSLKRDYPVTPARRPAMAAGGGAARAMP
ncbi:MAG: cbb3-type cytochrome c oxidase subunit II [Gemmatimonadaceae bacterium]